MSDRVSHTRRHLAFLAAAWLALVTAGVCAVWPAGLPRSQTVGSAFSPATAEVAIRGRADPLRATIQRIVDDNSGSTKHRASAGHELAVLPVATAISWSPAPVNLFPGLGRAEPRPCGAHGLRPYPRAPPIA